jgi:hypothetical protein
MPPPRCRIPDKRARTAENHRRVRSRVERKRNPGAPLPHCEGVPGFLGVYHRAGQRPDSVAQSGLLYFCCSSLLVLPLLASHKAVCPERISARLVGFNETTTCDAAAAPNRLLSALLFGIGVAADRGHCRSGCGCSSGVEHNLAKVGVEGSNPFARSSVLGRPHVLFVVSDCGGWHVACWG